MNTELESRIAFEKVCRATSRKKNKNHPPMKVQTTEEFLAAGGAIIHLKDSEGLEEAYNFYSLSLSGRHRVHQDQRAKTKEDSRVRSKQP